jgi:hypothetical protein
VAKVDSIETEYADSFFQWSFKFLSKHRRMAYREAGVSENRNYPLKLKLPGAALLLLGK